MSAILLGWKVPALYAVSDGVEVDEVMASRDN